MVITLESPDDLDHADEKVNEREKDEKIGLRNGVDSIEKIIQQNDKGDDSCNTDKSQVQHS